MKKTIAVILVLTAALIAFCGCKKGGTESPESGNSYSPSKWQEDVIANPDNYPSLTVEEFLSYIDGKSSAKEVTIPNDKACYNIERMNLNGYLIGKDIIYYSYVGSNEDNTICSLIYFVDGKIADQTFEFSQFKTFIETHSK